MQVRRSKLPGHSYHETLPFRTDFVLLLLADATVTPARAQGYVNSTLTPDEKLKGISLEKLPDKLTSKEKLKRENPVRWGESRVLLEVMLAPVKDWQSSEEDLM